MGQTCNCNTTEQVDQKEVEELLYTSPQIQRLPTWKNHQQENFERISAKRDEGSPILEDDFYNESVTESSGQFQFEISQANPQIIAESSPTSINIECVKKMSTANFKQVKKDILKQEKNKHKVYLQGEILKINAQQSMKSSLNHSLVSKQSSTNGSLNNSAAVQRKHQMPPKRNASQPCGLRQSNQRAVVQIRWAQLLADRLVYYKNQMECIRNQSNMGQPLFTLYLRQVKTVKIQKNQLWIETITDQVHVFGLKHVNLLPKWKNKIQQFCNRLTQNEDLKIQQEDSRQSYVSFNQSFRDHSAYFDESAQTTEIIQEQEIEDQDNLIKSPTGRQGLNFVETEEQVQIETFGDLDLSEIKPCKLAMVTHNVNRSRTPQPMFSTQTESQDTSRTGNRSRRTLDKHSPSYLKRLHKQYGYKN